MYLLLEQIPLYGTLILSVISGFLYHEVTAGKGRLVQKKVHSLLIPYLIANIVVVIPVGLSYLFFEYNFLNRLTFGPELLLDGIFAFSTAPVNPPTYFIRDLFVIFLIVEVLRRKNLYLFAGLILLTLFGELLLRFDILALFVCGALLSRFKTLYTHLLWPSVITCLLLSLLLSAFEMPYDKHLISILFFLLVINWKISFKDVGGYSYTLHLYHSPVIVVVFPILGAYISNPYLQVAGQLILVFSLTYIIYLLIRKLKLNMMIGGR